MKLQELKSVRAVVASGFNVTLAAEQLHTSQPGISRHVKQVEQALGIRIFERHKNRYIGLTSAGEALVRRIDLALAQIEDLRRVAADYANGHAGSLTVATSHTHARYSLPLAIERFIRDYPAVKLRLRQGHLQQIAEWLQSGEADISVSNAPSVSYPDLFFFSCNEIHRIIITKPGHPLLSKRSITIHDVARYPIITYDQESAARPQIEHEFNRHGLSANVVLSATDTDTMKTYVACGLGIGILANSAFDRTKDRGLRAIEARSLFPSIAVQIGLRREAPASAHTQHFINLFAPKVCERLYAAFGSARRT